MTKSKQQGFTLIELSIVLVIIGLIVGGVLVGQDLIKAAQIRATVAQMEKYDSAVNAFRGKYNGMPGDLNNPNNFFSSITNDGDNGCGDGDGLIEATATCSATASVIATPLPSSFGGENAMFWGQLTLANLIQEASTTTSYSDTLAVSDSTMPAAKMGKARMNVVASNGLNFYVMASLSGTAAAAVIPTVAYALTPIEAFQIDSKKDDGNPATGTVISVATGTTAIHTAANSGGGACYNGTAYNSGSVTGAQCALSVRTSF